MTNSNRLYCISGLGADKKAFQYLRIDDFELIHLDWIDPLPHESLKSYAQRLFDLYIKEDDYNVMGLSFGGMIAQEMAKLRAPKHLILISTITSGSKLPICMRIIGALRPYRLIPNKMIKSTNFITRYLFGTQDPKVAEIFKAIQDDSDPKYIKWAIGAIVKWRNNSKHNGIQIHGTKDKLLPISDDASHRVKDGGHLMLIDHADEVSAVINAYIK